MSRFLPVIKGCILVFTGYEEVKPQHGSAFGNADAQARRDVFNFISKRFSQLVTEKPEYDVFSMIDTYMQYSEVRHKMDLGYYNALNKGWKQLFNSIDFTRCKPRIKDIPFDGILFRVDSRHICSSSMAIQHSLSRNKSQAPRRCFV